MQEVNKGSEYKQVSEVSMEVSMGGEYGTEYGGEYKKRV